MVGSYYSFSPASLLVALYVLTASVSIPFVAAQKNQTEITTDQLYAKISSTAATPGFNVDGGSVFNNYVNAFNNKQLFFLGTSRIDVRERPGSIPTQPIIFYWCSDLTFSDLSNSSLMGYAGRCVAIKLAKKLGKGKVADIIALIEAGDKLPFAYSPGDFVKTRSISAVYVEQLNIFQGQLHSNTDDWVVRNWDRGLKTAPWIACMKATTKEIWHPTLPQALSLHLEKSLGCLLKR